MNITINNVEFVPKYLDDTYGYEQATREVRLYSQLKNQLYSQLAPKEINIEGVLYCQKGHQDY